MKVLVNAGPWLEVPPPGYGGIENVVATLVPCLRARGVQVVLASVGSSTLEVDELLFAHPRGRFAELQRPYNQVMGLAHAHQAMVARELRRRDDIDLVHDHLEVVGPAVLAALSGPPVLHTLHWDLRKHPEFYGAFPSSIAVNGVSESQLARAPAALRAASLGFVHLATPVTGRYPRGDHFVVMGRICPLKGQHVAARMCQKLGLPLVLAGPVSGLESPAELAAVLDDPDHPLHGHPDVRYFADQVAPCLDGDLVRWVGAVGGPARDRLYGTARAALFPIQWDEPGGTALVEALALGVPPIGLRRGCLPELVDHGRTGYLAGSEEELAEWILRADTLDPEECRAEAAARFTPDVMAERYLALYERIRRTRAATR